MAGICCPSDSGDVLAVAGDLLGCLVAALDECDAPACRASLVPGSGPVAHDVCCECCADDGSTADGQAWVRLVSLFPSQRFPVPESDPTRCGRQWAATFELGVVRCVHVLAADGSTPCAADLTADALKTIRDASILARVATCCFADDDLRDVSVSSYSPTGPQGGCAGGTVDVTVTVTEPSCVAG